MLHLTEVLEGIAAVIVGRQPRRAAELLGAADALRRSTTAVQPKSQQAVVARTLGRVTARLSEPIFADAWARGQGMHMQAALDFALSIDHAVGDPVGDAPAGLSPREWEVAHLIALGRSNRDIAEALVVSTKTVETHVKHIFGKLGVQGRTEVAVWASRQATPTEQVAWWRRGALHAAASLYDNDALPPRLLTPLRVVLVCLALLASTVAPAVAAQEAAGLDGVRAAYHDLLDLFYRPLEPRDLLQAGWTALSSDAERHGVAIPGTLPALDSDADRAFETFATAYAVYVANLPTTYPPDQAAAAVANGMADSLHEQHTHYLSPAVMQRFLATVGGGQQATGLGIKLGGIGDDRGLIADVAPDSPAARAGLLPGDVILAADGKDLTSADTPTLSTALTGEQGTSVSLSIDRGNGPQTVTVTRGPYYFPPLESRNLPDGVGYLRLSAFVISGTTLPDGTELLADLDRRLDDLDRGGAQSLVLDLRGNGGGSVQTADELLGRFLPDTTRSVHEFDRRGHETYELASGRLHPRQLPMAVLINGGSASASEITAAALRDAQRAVLVGQRTAGALASSELIPLPGGGGLQIAVAAAGAADSVAQIDGVGISPDVTTSAARTLADYRSGHDPQIDVAVTALANAPPPPQSPLPRHRPSVRPSWIACSKRPCPASGEMPTNDRLSRE